MVFKDYYAILEIDWQSPPEQVRAAYRRLSKKWHPDLNPGKDVTREMQDINEAYALLKNPEKRARYDKEYLLHQQAPERPTEGQAHSQQTHHASDEQHNFDGWSMWGQQYNSSWWDVQDNDVENDMNEARRYAEDIVEDFLRNLKTTTKNAVQGAWDEVKGYVIGGIIITIIGILILMCAQ